MILKRKFNKQKEQKLKTQEAKDKKWFLIFVQSIDWLFCYCFVDFFIK